MDLDSGIRDAAFFLGVGAAAPYVQQELQNLLVKELPRVWVWMSSTPTLAWLSQAALWALAIWLSQYVLGLLFQ